MPLGLPVEEVAYFFIGGAGMGLERGQDHAVTEIVRGVWGDRCRDRDWRGVEVRDEAAVTHWRTTLGGAMLGAWLWWWSWLPVACTVVGVAVGLVVWRWRHRLSFETWVGRWLRSWWLHDLPPSRRLSSRPPCNGHSAAHRTRTPASAAHVINPAFRHELHA